MESKNWFIIFLFLFKKMFIFVKSANAKLRFKQVEKQKFINNSKRKQKQFYFEKLYKQNTTEYALK